MAKLPGEEAIDLLPRDEGRPVFTEPWSARAFAIVVKMYDKHHYSWPEWVDYFSAELAPPAHYPRPEGDDERPEGDNERSVDIAASKLTGDSERVDAEYSGYWLAACEKLLAAKGIVTKAELDDRTAALAEAESPGPRFAPGDRIVVRKVDPAGYSHLPLYVCDKSGVVERDLGLSASPGAGESRQRVYTVRFTARELWGSDASGRDNLFFSVWDSHMDSA